MAMPGGFREARELDEDEVLFFTQFKDHLQEQLNKQFETFQPVLVRSQVVAGTNYWVKYEVDDGEHIHVKIFKPLPY